MCQHEIPEELLKKFKTGRVALFIGAGCSMSAGLPGWKDLLNGMQSKYEKEHLVKDSDKKQLQQWFKKSDDFSRVAQYFKKQSPELYRTYLQNIFDPDLDNNPLEPPEYYRLFYKLPLKRIITTNFDKLLEDALPKWNSITWQDKEEMPRYLREDKKLVYHIHGRADSFGTLVHTHDEYKALGGTEGEQARNFLQRLFESYTILVIGYRLGDPVIQWVNSNLQGDWDMTPDWYSFSCNPSDEEYESERSERNLRLIPYRIDNTIDANKAHEQALTAWFRCLGEKLGIEGFEPVAHHAPINPPPHKGWITLNESFLSEQPVITRDARGQYYRGTEPTWGLINSGFTARRAITDTVLEKLEGTGFRAVLIKGAGGEGKTTILMQVAVDLYQKGFTVCYEADPDSDPYTIMRQQNGPLALVIDHADQIRNLSAIFRFASNRNKDTIILLAARTNEWNNSYAKEGLGDLIRSLQEVPIPKLQPGEAQDIAGLLIGNEMGVEKDVDVFAKRLLEDSNGFLLAAMLTATRGEPLAKILEDVVRKVSQWPDGDELLTALGLVVALESRKNIRGDHLFCTRRLFQEAIGTSRQQAMRLCYRLEGEISLRPRGDYRIETRHPIIAETLFPILFSGSAPLVDELDIHERLLSGAGRLSREQVKAGERKLLSILPLYYKRQQNIEFSRVLFKISSEADPKHAPVWQAWALMEKEADNVGELDTQYSARWLFRKGTEADPKNAHVWQAWALMEKEADNVGEANRLIDSGLANCPRSPELDLLKKKTQSLFRNHESKLERVKALIEQKDASAEAELKELLFCNPLDPDVLSLHRLWQQQEVVIVLPTDIDKTYQ